MSLWPARLKPAPLLIGCVALGSLLSFSDSQVPVQVKEVRGSVWEGLLSYKPVGGSMSYNAGSSLGRTAHSWEFILFWG